MGADAEREFDEFAAAAWPRLRRSAYLLCGDVHLAEDLAQTALVRTYDRWGRVRRTEALAYARRVVVNANIDRHRRRRGTREVGGDALLRADGPTSGEEDAVADRDHVVRLLAGLSIKERRVVVLRHYFDLSEADTAAELGVSRGTVKSTSSRALAKLRAGLETESDHRTGRTRR